jgi:carboxypeptidase family protein
MADATDSKSVEGNLMRVRLSPRASIMLVAWITLAQLTAAQSPTLRGTVFAAESGEPLFFSIVTLHPGASRQFVDAAGTFRFALTKPGTYLLSVRQIGFAPVDTSLVVDGDTTTIVHVALHHLAIELPPVTIAAERCTNPGPPDSNNAALRTIFDQLQENAHRLELLADSFPFEYTLERVVRIVNQVGDTGPPVTSKLHLSSQVERHHLYAVGRVVERAWGPWGNGDSNVVIHTATLEDLGKPEFIASHCFYLAGRDTVDGETFLRINFEPALRVHSADMAGAAFLDSLTYELRYTKTSLVRPENSLVRADLLSLTFRTKFHTIAPNISLDDSAIVVTKYKFGHGSEIERQRTSDIRFKRPPPVP